MRRRRLPGESNLIWPRILRRVKDLASSLPGDSNLKWPRKKKPGPKSKARSREKSGSR